MVHWVGFAAGSGDVGRNVKCEKCGRWYHYVLTRQARAGARRGTPDGAVEAAENLAVYRVMRGLETGVEVVACPDCGWVQGEMVAEAVRRAGRPWTRAASCLIAIAGMVLVVAYAPTVWVVDWAMPAERARMVHWAALACAALGVVALLIRAVARGRVDPNSGYPAWPRAVSGGRVGEPGKAGAEAVQRNVRIEGA
jgi:hypothetical protein